MKKSKKILLWSAGIFLILIIIGQLSVNPKAESFRQFNEDLLEIAEANHEYSLKLEEVESDYKLGKYGETDYFVELWHIQDGFSELSKKVKEIKTDKEFKKAQEYYANSFEYKAEYLGKYVSYLNSGSFEKKSETSKKANLADQYYTKFEQELNRLEEKYK